jgi:hypothetical protein
MMQSTPGTNFFSLPTELRLQIAVYALEQSDDVGILPPNDQVRIDPAYDAATNLSILLVCRDFHRDFGTVAYQMTRFIFAGTRLHNCSLISDAKLRNVRKVVVEANWLEIGTWQTFLFDKDCVALEELCVVSITDDDVDHAIRPVISLLRRLQNVKKIRIFPWHAECRLTYGRLVGAMYKDDHYHRYDAETAPLVGPTWWEPYFNSHDISLDFVKCEAEPVMAEEDYMVMMKPKIDEIMDWMDRWSTLRVSILDA